MTTNVTHHSECGTRFGEPCDCADIMPAPKVVRCGCGRKVECADFTNTCVCGRLFNWAGQALAREEDWCEGQDY